MEGMDISVVIPVYGCKAALDELYNRLTKSLQSITDEYEIILVDDCCPQHSWEVIEALCNKDDRVKGIELSRNWGQMRAILAGLDNAKGDWIIVMDCDLQDRPEEIPTLYNKALEGYDIVFARRKKRKDKLLKRLLSGLFYKVYRYATDGNYDGAISNYSIVSRQVINRYCDIREQHRGYVMYLKWLGYRQATIDVEHNERYEGKTGYNFKKRMNMALELLTSQSDKVLKLFAFMGLLMSVISLMVIVGLVIYHFVSDVTIGWTSIIATIMFVGGLTIMVIGVVGIYVGNIFMQVKERPLYAIRQMMNIGDKQ